MPTSNYGKHIAKLTQDYTSALDQLNCVNDEKQSNDNQKSRIEAVLIHSGSEQHYYGDDRGVSFQAYGHLLHWLPVNRPDQFVYFRPGEKPTYFQVVPNDFWYDQSIELPDDITQQFTVIKMASVSELNTHLDSSSIAYIGESANIAKDLGIEQSFVNSSTLLAHLDFCRAIKTSYELEQLRAANSLALQGHAAAKDCFLNGGSEYQIHMAYLSACNILEEESPYTNIIALDEKSAILHYQYKRKEKSEKHNVLLIDAGCRINGYGSDITRTSVSDNVHTIFRSLVESMEFLEKSLVTQIRPGRAYQELHDAALKNIGSVLSEHDICTGSADELLQQNIPQLFMPHGVGHLLGIQVHDVGGHQLDIRGGISPPPEYAPALRNTRTMEQDMVFTVEPGLYFIPLLLEPERNSARGKSINWKLVDELYACGGIRIEDNVRVINEGAENLTRQFE